MSGNPGVVLYRGPSLLDGEDIVAIATDRSRNAKTGPMVQTWILRADVSPIDAVATGADASICGDCVHRGHGHKDRTCYVQVGQGPSSVWKALQRGAYATQWAAGHFARRMVRLGAYGDPAAVPFAVWEAVLQGTIGWTGYTNQWRRCDVRLQRYVMASCATPAERDLAKAAGWRTYRVSVPGCGDPVKLAGEAVCPASHEAGAKLDCFTCGACDGLASGRRGDITIQAHGGVHIMRILPALHERANA